MLTVVVCVPPELLELELLELELEPELELELLEEELPLPPPPPPPHATSKALAPTAKQPSPLRFQSPPSQPNNRLFAMFLCFLSPV